MKPADVVLLIHEPATLPMARRPRPRPVDVIPPEPEQLFERSRPEAERTVAPADPRIGRVVAPLPDPSEVERWLVPEQGARRQEVPDQTVAVLPVCRPGATRRTAAPEGALR